MSRKRLSVNKKRTRYIKPQIIVLGDGATEKSYIERINDLEVFPNINIKYEKGDEHSYHTKVKEHANNQDNLFIILDVDNTNKDEIKHTRIKNIITNNKSQVFYNNYSFETWLLNHKITFGKPVIYKTQYDLDIKRNFNITSWSNNKNLVNRKKIMDEITVESIKKAKENIKNISSNKWDINPSSNMDEFLIKLEKINSKS